MSSTEGGAVDIAELLRRLGFDPLIAEAEAFGLSPKNLRARCPFECAVKGPTRERDARIFSGGHPRIFCHACNGKGDLLDLLQLSRGWTRDEAIAHLTGLQAPATRRPQLQLVPRPDDPEKLSPADAKKLWDALARSDTQGERYLEGRSLEPGELVRFATEQHPDASVKSQARRGYRVAVLLSDVVGNPRGVQLRLTREAKAKETKIVSVKGSSPGRAFFGHPERIESSLVVCVAEGLADTLALVSWAKDRDVAVVGAAGKQFLPKLAGELEEAGIDVSGKLFALFPQNDRPQNASRREFVRLGQLLAAAGARCVFVGTHPEHKDLAEWRHARPDVEWPPPELAKAYQPEPGDDTPAEHRRVLPEGCAVPIPAQVRAEYFAQDFTTLCTLLDDPMHRESVMGAGELTWCEMTWRVRHADRPIADVDLSTMRLGLEAQGRSTDGKPLKFSEDEVAKALAVIARRKTVHPVRDWLNGLRWDGVERLDVELPGVLNHEAGSFVGTLLKRWFISAVARAMRPGCKVDTVLVLVGGQGGRKSAFFEAIGGEWFTDSPVQVGDKDGKLIMRKAWIVEWGELEEMKRARNQEAIKAFLSARSDWFRKPYGREIIEAPRHCVIVGTSNPREFLHDPTGNRRFWPISVPERIDDKWLEARRAQLFAEAVHRYRAGEQWWLTPEEDAQLIDVNRDHEVQDVWSDPIEDWLSDHLLIEYVTTAQILHEVFKKDIDNWTDGDARRVANILVKLGWKLSKRIHYGGKHRRGYVRG